MSQDLKQRQEVSFIAAQDQILPARKFQKTLNEKEARK